MRYSQFRFRGRKWVRAVQYVKLHDEVKGKIAMGPGGPRPSLGEPQDRKVTSQFNQMVTRNEPGRERGRGWTQAWG